MVTVFICGNHNSDIDGVDLVGRSLDSPVRVSVRLGTETFPELNGESV